MAPAAVALLDPPDRRQVGRPFCALLLPFVFGATIIGRSKRPRRWYGALRGFLPLLWFLQTARGDNRPVTHPLRNYVVTVAAASGAVEHTTQVALTVQQLKETPDDGQVLDRSAYEGNAPGVPPVRKSRSLLRRKLFR